MRDILHLLELILKAWRVEIKDALFYGSSGGGFTALALATLAKARAMALNPQFFCLNFWPNLVAKFKRSCLRANEEPLMERLDILELMRAEQYVPPAIIYQCLNARRDLETQFFPFLAGLPKLNLPIKRLRTEFYEHPRGHKGMPDKESAIAAIYAYL